MNLRKDKIEHRSQGCIFLFIWGYPSRNSLGIFENSGKVLDITFNAKTFPEIMNIILKVNCINKTFSEFQTLTE